MINATKITHTKFQDTGPNKTNTERKNKNKTATKNLKKITKNTLVSPLDHLLRPIFTRETKADYVQQGS